MGRADQDAAEYDFQPFGSAARHEAAWIDQIWFDNQRGRNVPARLYYPTDSNADEKFPVILFSTGLGQSRDDCAYLGRHWARCGYVAVHIQHEGSDQAVRQGTVRPRKQLQRAFYAPQNIRNRPMDMLFVIAQLDAMQQEGAVPADRCDLERIGAAGHDFGAQTALGVAGQVLPGRFSFAEPRIKAVVVMGAPVPLGQVPLDVAYGDVAVPCLHITGTHDDSIVATTRASQRRLPFDYSQGADQFLLTFFGADHLTYSGRRRGAEAAADAIFQARIAECSAVFWDAYLKGDARAKAWLITGGLDDRVGRLGRVESKPASR